MYETPFFSQSSTSVGLIGREASEMSVSPAQNFLKPPPVPEMPMVTRTLGWDFWNSSATASVIGYTVLEPSAVIRPSRLELAAAPETATTRARRVVQTSVTRCAIPASFNLSGAVDRGYTGLG